MLRGIEEDFKQNNQGNRVKDSNQCHMKALTLSLPRLQSMPLSNIAINPWLPFHNVVSDSAAPFNLGASSAFLNDRRLDLEKKIFAQIHPREAPPLPLRHQ